MTNTTVTNTSSATEKVVEEGVERSVDADTGEDVEIDFDADGNFSIETEDGSFSIEEDGSFTLDTEDGLLTSGTGENASVLTNGLYSITGVADAAAGYLGDSILQVTVISG